MKKIIRLSKEKFAIVDEEDFDLLNKFKWCVFEGNGTFYARTNLSRKLFPRRKYIRMHRMILNAPDNALVDHVDGNGLNNTRANLRICTPIENRRNHKIYSTNTTGYTGVSADGRRFSAKISVKGKTFHLGRFSTAEEAAIAYNQAAIKYFCEFARLNFIPVPTKTKDKP